MRLAQEIEAYERLVEFRLLEDCCCNCTDTILPVMEQMELDRCSEKVTQRAIGENAAGDPSIDFFKELFRHTMSC